MNKKDEDILFAILKETKTLINFFDVIFGFLYRKTDFYTVTSNQKESTKLSAEEIENLMFHEFYKYYKENACECQEVTKKKLPNLPKNPVSPEKLLLDSHNGAHYENYAWSQSKSDIDIQILLQEKVKPKQLSLKITSCSINVRLKNNSKPILEGYLCDKIWPTGNIWALKDYIMHIHLEKAGERWWNCLLTTEPKINLCKIVCNDPNKSKKNRNVANLKSKNDKNNVKLNSNN